jgi:hypothetical protein
MFATQSLNTGLHEEIELPGGQVQVKNSRRHPFDDGGGVYVGGGAVVYGIVTVGGQVM